MSPRRDVQETVTELKNRKYPVCMMCGTVVRYAIEGEQARVREETLIGFGLGDGESAVWLAAKMTKQEYFLLQKCGNAVVRC